MTEVWSLDLPDSEKLVLLALADSANDEGHCWPGMKSLVRKCSKTDRTIQAAIKALVDAGHLTRREVVGKGCNYTVHPRSGCTPEVTSPPKGTTRTPEAVSGKPLRTIKSVAKATSAGAKSVFPKGWLLPAISSLPPKAAACAAQWTTASYETHGEAFASYWRSEGKMKVDWEGTWANRVIDLHSKVLRDQKFGNAPTDVVLMPCGPTDWAERAKFFDKIGKRDDADDCRRKVVPIGQITGDLMRRVRP